MRIKPCSLPKKFRALVPLWEFGFFAWVAAWDKILTFDILLSRGWTMSNRCSLYKASDESTKHALIHCERTRKMLMLLAIFGIQWVFLDSVKELLLGWEVKGMDKGRGGCGVWPLSQERNKRIFGGVEFNNLKLKKTLISLWWDCLEYCWGGILLLCWTLLMI